MHARRSRSSFARNLCIAIPLLRIVGITSRFHSKDTASHFTISITRLLTIVEKSVTFAMNRWFQISFPRLGFIKSGNSMGRLRHG